MILGLVVERTGQKARCGGLPNPAHAGQHEGVGYAARLKRIGERPDHRLLSNQILEPARPVFARKHLIGFRFRSLILPEHGEGLVVALFGEFGIAHRTRL
jgi:hypothetical protein